jgi:hypothetical protein
MTASGLLRRRGTTVGSHVEWVAGIMRMREAQWDA